MPRWEGNSQRRLEESALSLFAQQGYDATSVAQIAQHAGLTERSFYRWFPDKREVLFAEAELSAALVEALGSVPEDVEALPALIVALAGADNVLRPREFLTRRAAVVATTPALQERELSKLDLVARTLTAALARRGCSPDQARLAVDVAMVILRSATQQWIENPSIDFEQAVADNARRLSTIAGTIQA